MDLASLTISLLALLGVSLVLMEYLKRYMQAKIDEAKEEYFERLVKSLGNKITRLDPNKRYLLSVDTDMDDKEFEEMVEGINDHLDLESSDVKVVITNSTVKIVEFE